MDSEVYPICIVAYGTPEPALLMKGGGPRKLGIPERRRLNRANCYLVVPEETKEIKAGEWVSVLPR